MTGVRAAVRPPRGTASIAASALADAIGSGIFLSSSVVFFTRRLGLDAGTIAAALAVAGIVALVVVAPLGALTDRVGHARSLRVAHFARAAIYPCYLLVDGPAGFIVVVVAVTVADRLSAPVFQAMVGRTVGAGRRTETMGYVRALRNAGFSLGALIASLALAADTAAAYDALVLGNAASFAVAGLLLLRTPNRRSEPTRSTGPRLRGVGLGYLRLTALNGLLQLHDTMLLLALPLYVVHATRVPASVLPLLFALNTLLVVVLQRRLSRRAETVADAARAEGRAGWYLALTCLLFAAAGPLPPLPATAALVLGVAVLTVGESLQIAGAWEISRAHAPPAEQGKYLAAFSLGLGLQRSLGPGLLPVLGALGAAAWLPLGAVLVVGGQLMRRWSGSPPAFATPEPAGADGGAEPDRPSRHRPALS